MANGLQSFSLNRRVVPTLGSMRDRVTVQEPSNVDDGLGGKVSGFSTVDTVNCRILRLSANAEFFARQVDYRITHQVAVRHTTRTRQYKRGYIILWTDDVGERTLKIESVRDLDNKRRWAVIDCIEDERNR